MIEAIVRRLQRLETGRVTYRPGTVTATSPLTVELDGAPIANIPRLETAWVPIIGELVWVRLGPGGPVCEGRYI